MRNLHANNFPLVRVLQGDILIRQPASKPLCEGLFVLSGRKGGQSPTSTKDALTGGLDVGCKSVRLAPFMFLETK